MHPDVLRLAELLGPPAVNLPPVPWSSSRSEIGVDFPEDYREFIDLYGGLTFNDEFSVRMPHLEPSGPGAPEGFKGFSFRTAGGIGRHLGPAYESGDFKKCPYPIFPHPGSLLAWGQNSNGDYCFWVTEGDEAGLWPTAIWHRQAGRWRRFEGGMAALLVAGIEGDPRFSSLGIKPGSEGIRIDWERSSDWNGWSHYYSLRHG